MPLIGTAGHVDHGKSTLIEALSGRDPDRWAEEKRRGLTIDLGFAWTDLGGGEEVSFVDVPGHERYLKNMLAGIEAIDIALLVVAADEGWMPQSEEHLAVLDLLDVSRGLVALTKTDLVDAETIELAELEVQEHLEGTALEGADIVPVSATTGSGLDRLRSGLLALTSELDGADNGHPRLWIDRSFSVSGAGTVVTGTLLEGPITVGDTVEIYPTGTRARVRSLQSHERDVEIALPRTRVAVGLSGVSKEQSERGHMLGTPGKWRTTERFSAAFRTARYAEDLSEKGAYQLHVGSGTHQIRLQKVEGSTLVATSVSPIPLRTGDRFIIRDSGRRLVVAGGRVLDPQPGSLTSAIRNSSRIDAAGAADLRATQLLSIRRHDQVVHLSQDSGGGAPVDAIVVGQAALTPGTMERLISAGIELTSREHAQRPFRQGISLATFAVTLGVSRELAEEVINRSASLDLVGPDVSLLSHQPRLDGDALEDWTRVRDLLGESLSVPTTAELELSEEVTHFLVRTGELVRISENLVYLPEQIEEITGRIGGLSGPFGVGDAKDALGLSRKYIVPILEWLDANQVTVRRGEARELR